MFPLIAALAIAAQAGPSDAPEADAALYRVHVSEPRDVWAWGVKQPSGKIRLVERRQPDYRTNGVLIQQQPAEPDYRASDAESLAKLRDAAEKAKPCKPAGPEAPAEKAEGVLRDAAWRLVWNEIAGYVFAAALGVAALIILLIRSWLRSP